MKVQLNRYAGRRLKNAPWVQSDAREATEGGNDDSLSSGERDRVRGKETLNPPDHQADASISIVGRDCAYVDEYAAFPLTPALFLPLRRRGSAASGGREAFTLIEMMAVLAIIAILAVIIAPNLLKQLDLAAGSQEVTTLQTLGNALQSSIQRNFYIPGAADWATVIGTELGLDPADVSTNGRGRARILLIDPAFQVGTNGYGVLPYTQTINGSASNAVSPRFLILSSTTTALPAAYLSGVPATSNDFSAIWNTADGGLPPTAAFTGWTGVNDLHVQRINLAPLFVQLVLNTDNSLTNGLYAIPPNVGTNLVPLADGISAYFLQNTTVRLINNSPSGGTNVDSDQILIHKSSFVYYQNVWLSSLGITVTNVALTGSAAVSGDFNSIVANFLAAPVNSQATGGATAQLVVTDMISYLQAYDAWALGNFTSTPLYNNAVAAQSTMMTAINNLINGL